MSKLNKLFAYPGGKWMIRSTVISCFPEHQTYVDVFGGAASILIAKQQSAGEVFNDANEEIVNFFRVVKHRPAELAEAANLWVHSRREFYRLRDGAKPIDELERALRFWVLVSDSFGARGRHFGTAKDGIHSVTQARAHLTAVSQRLARVHVECLDFSQCVKVYDAPGSFFYVDPPYRGTTGGSSHYENLTDEQWQSLRDQLTGIKGKFLLSSNADPLVMELFKRFELKHIDVRVTLPRKKDKQVRKEILVSNYPLPAGALLPARNNRHRAAQAPDRNPARTRSVRKAARCEV